MLKPVYLGQILFRDGNSFDLVRLLLATLVIFSHAIGISTLHSMEPLHAATGFTLGAHAVHGFFVLSGILVMASWQRLSDFKIFMIARMSRVFPALIVVIIALAFIIGPLLTTSSRSDYFSDIRLPLFIIKSIFMLTGSGQLPGVFETVTTAQNINTPIWTLKYEVMCYVLLGLGGVIGLLKGQMRSAIVLGILIIICIWRMSLNVPSTEHGLLDHLARLGFAFCLGAMFWVCRSKLLISPFILIGLGVLAFALHNSFLSLPLMVSFTGYATLVVGAMHFGALSRITRRNDLSYGMYIMGFPTQQALMLFFPNITGVLNGLLAMVIVMPMAYLSWHYVEKPALRLKSRFDRKKAPQNAEPLGK